MPKIRVVIETEDAIKVTEDQGGYLGGECVLCRAGGWLFKEAPLGWPYGSPQAKSNGIIHKENCGLGKMLDENGGLKKEGAKKKKQSPKKGQRICSGGPYDTCTKPATWIRHTQFSGDHLFCDAHARQEADFGESDSLKDWKQLTPLAS